MALPKSALNEATALAIAILKAIESTVGGQSGIPGAELQFMCGELIANAATEFAASFPTALSTTPAPAGTFWGDFTACFDQAQFAGTTFVQFETIRILAEAATPVSAAAISVRNFSVRMALVEEARILAATTFASRNQINRYVDLVRENFEAAILVAAGNMDNVAYQALLSLQNAVVNDLSTRALQLPRLINYSTPRRTGALYLSQRIYQDPTRVLEILNENDVIAPNFCPQQLQVLSS